MDQREKSGWERLFDEAKSPLDWATIIVGGAAGAGATMAMHGLDLGHSIPTRALAALGARRTWVAGRRHDRLLARAGNLSRVMKKNRRNPALVEALDYAIEKAAEKAMTNDKFELEIAKIEDEDSNE